MRQSTLIGVISIMFFATSPAISQVGHVDDSSRSSTTSVESEKTNDSTDRKAKKNMLTIDPIIQLVDFNITYTRALSSSIAVAAGIQVGSDDLGVNAEFRYYLTGFALQGMYISPVITIKDGVSIDALVGWQWFPEDNFTFGIAAGIGIGSDIYPALRAQVGYPW